MDCIAWDYRVKYSCISYVNERAFGSDQSTQTFVPSFLKEASALLDKGEADLEARFIKLWLEHMHFSYVLNQKLSKPNVMYKSKG